jgi:hypothetical protein
MVKRQALTLAASAILILFSSPRVSAGSDSPASIYNKMSEVNLSRVDSIQEKVDKLERLFHESFEPLLKNPKNITNEDLRLLYGASDMLASYTMFFNTERNAGYVGNMAIAFRELGRRSVATDEDIGNMFDALMASRRFEEALSLKSSHQALADKLVPAVVRDTDFQEDAPAEMAIASTQGGFSLRNVNLDKDYLIVIVSGCHISEDATKAINASPSLRDAFIKGNAIWLAPADRNFDIQAVQRWNKEFPRQSITVAYRNEAWKGVDFSQIPAFYFYKNGKLIAEHVGWKKAGVPPKITATLRSMGLLVD